MKQFEPGLWTSLFLVVSAYAAATTTGGCAGGNELGGGGTSLGGGTPGASSSSEASSSSIAVSSSASSSSAGGSGGAGTGGTGGSGVGGAGGAGGATSASASAASSSAASTAASTSASSTAASTSASSGSGGGQPTHLVVLAAGHTSALGASFDPGTSMWTTTTLTDASDDRVGLAFDGNGLACGAIKSTTNADVDFFLWNDAGNGVWSASAQLGTDTTLTGPAMSGGSGLVDLVFQGNLGAGQNKFFYAQRDASWSVTADPVGGSANQSFGPTPASVARLGVNVEVAYAGSDGDLYTQEGQTGAWGAATAHGLGSNAVLVTPGITTLIGDTADLMVVYVVNDATPANRKIKFTTHTASGWSTPAVIDPNAFTNEPANVVGLANGDALVLYRGTDSKGYLSRWTGSPRAWTVPAAISSGTITTAPNAAPGASGADAEIVYVDSANGAANHGRLVGTTVSTSTIGGSGLTFAAIASQ